MDKLSEDLNAVINCQNKMDFRYLFSFLHDEHYPEKSFLALFLDTFGIMAKQIPKNFLYNYIFNFTENRLFFGRKDYAKFRFCYDLNTIIYDLFKNSMITQEDVNYILNNLVRNSAEEKWQYRKLYNTFLWNAPSNQDKEITAYLQNLLNTKEYNSMFSCDEHSIDTPPLADNKEFFISEGKESFNLNISPHTYPRIWKSWSKYSENKGNGLRFSSPFSIDTNHLKETGLFYLVASIDMAMLTGEVRKVKPDFSLGNSVLSLKTAMNLTDEGHYFVHCGIGGQEKDAAGKPTGMSSWWLNKQNIYSSGILEQQIIFADNPGNWSYMGRNKYSPPYFSYKYLPLNDVLNNCHSLFFIIKQEAHEKIIEGDFYIFDASLSWAHK